LTRASRIAAWHPFLWPPAIALIGGWASGPITHLGVVGDILLVIISVCGQSFTWANQVTAPLVRWSLSLRFAATIAVGLAPFVVLDRLLLRLTRNDVSHP
jgi:hypothetical protein